MRSPPRPIAAHLLSILLVAAAMSAPTPARAGQADAPDVVVYADPTMARALNHLATSFRARTGVPVRVFPIPGSLAVALVRQGARNDVLAVGAGVAESALARGLAHSPALSVWDDVVLAGPAGSVATSAAAATGALGGGRLATVDPVSPDRLDGPALAQALAIPASQVAGQPSGPDAASLVAQGGAELALVERADARLPGVREVAAIPESLAPARRYAIAASHNAITPQLDRFLAYLAGPDAAASLAGDGWEVAK